MNLGSVSHRFMVLKRGEAVERKQMKGEESGRKNSYPKS